MPAGAVNTHQASDGQRDHWFRIKQAGCWPARLKVINMPYSSAKLNAALRECLETCENSEQPFRRVAVFIRNLAEDFSYNRDDLAELERVAMRILSRHRIHVTEEAPCR